VFALGAGASFIARAVDVDQKGLPGIMADAKHHQGAALVEILQNCIVYNKDVFDDVVAKKTAAETQIHVVHGERLRYGKDGNKGLRLNPQTLRLEGVVIGENGVTEADILVHDETNPNLAQMLLHLEAPLPTAMGVIHRVSRPSFETSYWAHKPTGRRKKVQDLLQRGNLVDRR